MTWYKHKKLHRKATIKGIIRSKIRNLAIKNPTPAKEIRDYETFRPEIRKRRAIYVEINQPELNRYEHFSLPSQKRVSNIKLKFSRLRNVKPIEIKTKDGQLKVVEFKPSSHGWGGVYKPLDNEIIIDDRLKDETDWTMRKGTIAHEYQHSIDSSEQTPSSVNNIVRQMLLQNFPNVITVGAFEEIQRMARRFGKRLHKEFARQPNGETILIYSFTHNETKYAFAKDILWVTPTKLRELAIKHNKQIKNTNVNNNRYKYITFRFVNVFEKNP